MRALPIIVLALLLPIAGAVAQSVESSRLLAIPAGAVLCRPVPVTPADSAAFTLKFRDTVAASMPARAREITASYDSLGRPLYMAITIASLRGSPRELTLFMIRLAPFTGGVRVEPDNDVPTASSFGAPRAAELSEADLKQAHRLAADLWMRGCVVPHAPPPAGPV